MYLHVLAYLVSSLSSSRGREGTRECVCDGRRHPEQATALHVLRLFAAGPLALARPSNDVLVKSQESRAKSQESSILIILASGQVMSAFVLLGKVTASSSSPLFWSF